MAGGSRPKPSHLAVVDKRHAYRHKDQAEPSKEWPVAPEYLTETAKAIFDRMVARISDLYPPSASHTEMLVLYAESEEMAQHLDRKLRETGLTYDTGYGTRKPYPEVAILKDAKKLCFDILKEFGLSPSAQRSVPVQKKKETANPFADLKKAAE